jgi:hypothetical protein
MRTAAMGLMIVLVGCTTYPDTCDRRALHERRTVEGLIRQTEGNLRRGYSYQIVESNWNTGFMWCSGSGWGHNPAFCTGSNAPTYRRIPVAIDPAAEQRKLESLQRRRAALIEATAECTPL